METVRALPEYLPGWLDALAEDGREPKTLSLYQHTVQGWLAWHCDRALSRAALHQYVRYLQVDHRGEGTDHAGLRPRTIRRMFTALRSFWRYVRLQGLELPAIEAVTLPRLDTARRRVHTDSEVRAMFAAASHVGDEAHSKEWKAWLRARARCILALLAGCALRRGELLALDVSDVREEAGGWICSVRRGKAGQARVMPIAPEYEPIIREWVRIRSVRALRLGHLSPSLFHEEKGARLGNVGLMNCWHTLLVLAGLETTGLTPHGLRHWAATSILKRHSAKVAQAFLGHASVLTTLTVYAHADADDVRNAGAGLAGTIHAPVEETEKRTQAGPATPADRGSRGLRRTARRPHRD